MCCSLEEARRRRYRNISEHSLPLNNTGLNYVDLVTHGILFQQIHTMCDRLVEFVEQCICRADCKVMLGFSTRRWVAPLTPAVVQGSAVLGKGHPASPPSPVDPLKTPSHFCSAPDNYPTHRGCLAASR